jgi:hypothetical protein
MMHMKKVICFLLLMMCAAGAMADGQRAWVRSAVYGYTAFASYADEYDGYRSVDGLGGVTSADPFYLRVISKSASVWSEPRSNSKKLASVSHGDILMCRDAESADDIRMENGFFAVEYKTGTPGDLPAPAHAEQLSRYLRLLGEASDLPVRGVLVYLDRRTLIALDTADGDCHA